jgi:hypothetical protein
VGIVEIGFKVGMLVVGFIDGMVVGSLLGIVETGCKIGVLVVGFIEGNFVGILLGLILFEGIQLSDFEGAVLGCNVVVVLGASVGDMEWN